MTFIKSDDKQRIGIDGFIVEARIREVLNYSADVPELHLEDGSVANDHIILKPVRIDIEGIISDVTVQQSSIVKAFINANKTIGRITKYTSEWTQAQMSKINAMALTVRDIDQKITDIINDGGTILDAMGLLPDSLKGIPVTKQFMDAMKALFFNKKPFQVEVYGTGTVYENMFMTSWIPSFDNKDDGISYKMSLVEIRYVKTSFALAPAPSDELKGQTVSEADKGVMATEKVEQSTLHYMVNG